MQNKAILEIFTDGASRGNPGKAAWAFLFVKDGIVIKSASEYIGIATNNVAEYRAVIAALDTALLEGYRDVRLCSDSELVIRQLQGEYKVRKKHLLSYWKKVLALARKFESISFRSVPRSNAYIIYADKICNEMLDRASE